MFHLVLRHKEFQLDTWFIFLVTERTFFITSLDLSRSIRSNYSCYDSVQLSCTETILRHFYSEMEKPEGEVLDIEVKLLLFL